MSKKDQQTKTEDQQNINVTIVMPKSHWFRNVVILSIIVVIGLFVVPAIDVDNKSIQLSDWEVRWTEDGIKIDELSFPSKVVASINDGTEVVNDMIVPKTSDPKPAKAFVKSARKDKSLDGYTVEEIAEATFRSHFNNAVEAQIIRLRSSYENDGRFSKMKAKDLKRLEVQMRYLYQTRTRDQLESYAYSQTTYSMTDFGTVMQRLLPFDKALKEALTEIKV